MLKLIEKRLDVLPMDTPLEQVRIFIDQVMHDLWKQRGRTTESIRTGHAHRASV